MKDSHLKNTLTRGFTLIELMIVIVILGVLMGTILPRLTGAQARARDTGRVADLNTLSQALETFFDDNGRYPGNQGTAYCLDPDLTEDAAVLGTNDHPSVLLGDYLKGGDVPTPPSDRQVTGLDASTSASADNSAPPCLGAYLYMPLVNRGLARNGYMLLTDVETWQNANADLTTSLPAASTITSVSDYSPRVTDLDSEPSGATGERASAYLIVN